MRLARYILSEHVGPFAFGLLVITFVLIIDFVPRVLDLVVGRDIAAAVVTQLFVYNLAWMMALSVPMAVLVATLMAFGRLSADNEIVALKSSGVHLWRLLWPVLLAGSLVGAFLVWFNNEVLPESNHEARVLMGNINRTRPTLRLRENVFNGDIPGYFLNKLHEARSIIHEVAEPNLGLQFDLYHRQVEDGDVAVAMKEYANLTRHYQIASPPDRGEPDEGEMNYRWLLQQIDASGYKGWVGCEYKPRRSTVEGLTWAAACGVKLG